MCKSGPFPVQTSPSNFHAIWDGTLIRATTWSWGTYVDRLEGSWLTSPEAKRVDGGTPAGWHIRLTAAGMQAILMDAKALKFIRAGNDGRRGTRFHLRSRSGPLSRRVDG